MDNADWIALLKRLPPSLMGQVVLVTTSEVEVSLEMIFRLEPTYAVVRGRLSGTIETGLLFFVPYDQIACVCVNREMREAEVNALFEGEGGAETPPAAAAVPEPAPAAPPEPAAPATGPVRNTTLLERIRAAKNAALPPPRPEIK